MAKIYNEIDDLVWPVRRQCLTSTQLALLVFMKVHGLKYIAWYPGPPGTEGMKGRGGFYWRQKPRRVPVPPLDGRTVGGLIKRGLLVEADDNDYELTDLGRKVGAHPRARLDYNNHKEHWGRP